MVLALGEGVTDVVLKQQVFEDSMRHQRNHNHRNGQHSDGIGRASQSFWTWDIEHGDQEEGADRAGNRERQGELHQS